jgi:hypothetical protein
VYSINLHKLWVDHRNCFHRGKLLPGLIKKYWGVGEEHVEWPHVFEAVVRFELLPSKPASGGAINCIWPNNLIAAVATIHLNDPQHVGHSVATHWLRQKLGDSAPWECICTGGKQEQVRQVL